MITKNDVFHICLKLDVDTNNDVDHPKNWKTLQIIMSRKFDKGSPAPYFSFYFAIFLQHYGQHYGVNCGVGCDYFLCSNLWFMIEFI